METPDQLKARMEGLHVQQTELAQALGVTQGTISRWLNGEREMPPVRAAQIGSYLDQAEADPGSKWPPEAQDLFETDWHLRWAPLRRLAGKVDPVIGELLHVAADLPRDRHVELVEEARRMREIDLGPADEDAGWPTEMDQVRQMREARRAVAVAVQAAAAEEAVDTTDVDSTGLSDGHPGGSAFEPD